MKYTTYIWRESNREVISSAVKWFWAGSHDASYDKMIPLENLRQTYYAGMTSQHIEARLVTPKLGWSRDGVELLWSKTYDNLKDASTVENECISFLRNKAHRTAHAMCDNQNANKRGWNCESEWPKYISADLSEVEKIIDKSLARTVAWIPKVHQERSQKLIKETQATTFANIEKNAERLAKDSKVIQDMLAQYTKEHQTPKAKQARTKSQWDIVNMKKAIKTLKQTLAAYKANKLATTT